MIMDSSFFFIYRQTSKMPYFLKLSTRLPYFFVSTTLPLRFHYNARVQRRPLAVDTYSSSCRWTPPNIHTTSTTTTTTMDSPSGSSSRVDRARPPPIQYSIEKDYHLEEHSHSCGAGFNVMTKKSDRYVLSHLSATELSARRTPMAIGSERSLCARRQPAHLLSTQAGTSSWTYVFHDFRMGKRRLRSTQAS